MHFAYYRRELPRKSFQEEAEGGWTCMKWMYGRQLSYYRKSTSSSEIIGNFPSNFAHASLLFSAYWFNEAQFELELPEMVAVELSNKTDAFFSKPGEFLQDAAISSYFSFSLADSVGIFIFTKSFRWLSDQVNDLRSQRRWNFSEPLQFRIPYAT